MKTNIEETINDLKTLGYLNHPYLYSRWEESVKQISSEDLIAILENEAEGIRYFSDDDATDGGVIEVMCKKFNKLLPEDNNFDMRDYCSFIIEGTDYYVFFLDEWPDAE